MLYIRFRTQKLPEFLIVITWGKYKHSIYFPIIILHFSNYQDWTFPTRFLQSFPTPNTKTMNSCRAEHIEILIFLVFTFIHLQSLLTLLGQTTLYIYIYIYIYMLMVSRVSRVSVRSREGRFPDQRFDGISVIFFYISSCCQSKQK